jgi:RNA polymerase sigma-70 factor (ECF subfamily)
MANADDIPFPTTRWTLVAHLRSADPDVARRALEELLKQYRYPLYAYIRRRGLTHHDAEDALHDFLEKLLRLQSREDADAVFGRLRGFLSKSLARFLINWQRHDARHGLVGYGLPSDTARGDEARYAQERFAADDTAELVFERKWGHALMERVMSRLRMQCDEQGKRALFFALRPVLLGGGGLRGHDTAVIAKGLGMSEGNLRVALSRHLREYRKVLEEEVLQTVGRPEEVPGEIAHLMSLFRPVGGNPAAVRSRPAPALEHWTPV